MKNPTITFFCFVIFFIAGCSKSPSPEIMTRSDEFLFVLSYIPCGGTPLDYYDSSKNLLNHVPLGETTHYTITLQLTDAELDAILQKAVDLRYFELPAVIVPPENSLTIYQAPSGSSWLTMMNGDAKNSVYWDDQIITKPLYEDAQRFSGLVNFILDILTAHDEYRQLPPNTAACA